jgi:hypothetical protein
VALHGFDQARFDFEGVPIRCQEAGQSHEEDQIVTSATVTAPEMNPYVDVNVHAGGILGSRLKRRGK